MKAIKKALSLVCALVLLVAMFMGCGAAPQGSADNSAGKSTAAVEKSVTPTTDATKAEPITLRVYWWGGDARHKATLDALDNYMTRNPNVKIESEYQGYDGYREKLVTQFGGGTAPDIYQIDQMWMYDLGDNAADINTLKDKIDLSGFDAKFLTDNCVVNNRLIGLPTGLDCFSTVYNKTALEKAGITMTESWDWEKLMEIGKKLQAYDKDTHLLNADVMGLDYLLKMYIQQRTGKRFLAADGTMGFTKEDLTAMYQLEKDMFDNGIFQSFAQFMMYDGKDFENPAAAQDKLLASISNITTLITQRNLSPNSTFGVADIPITKGSTFSGGMVMPNQILCINGASKNIAAATDLFNYWFNDKEAVLKLQSFRAIQPTTNGRKWLAEANLLDPLMDKGLEIAYKSVSPLESGLQCNEEIVAINFELIQKVGYGKSTPAAAADELIQRYNEKIPEILAK